MYLEDFNFSDLPNGKKAAFTTFAEAISSQFNQRVRDDRNYNSDQNGNYDGSYEPDRGFVSGILAVLDEYGIDAGFADISCLGNSEFVSEFSKFKSKVDYLIIRYKIRQQQIDSGTIGTLIAFDEDYKSEIGNLLSTIRKIVNQEISNKNKRDAIFAKISKLQLEVDRDRTTLDAFSGKILDLSDALGQAGEKIAPLVDKMERVKKLFWDKAKRVEELPSPDRQKQITSEKSEPKLDDEIPF